MKPKEPWVLDTCAYVIYLRVLCWKQGGSLKGYLDYATYTNK